MEKENLKILHFADSHLRDDEQLPEKEHCLKYLVKTAQIEEPDLIVCAGDVFDSQYVRLDSKSAKLAIDIFALLGDFAPVAVVGGTPSHEGTATEVFAKIRAKYPIHVSTAAEQIYYARQLQKFVSPESYHPQGSPPAAILSMVPAFTKQYLRTDADIQLSDAQAAAAVTNMMGGFGAAAIKWDCPHILVGHFPVGGALVSDTQMLTGVDIEVSREMIELARADVVCLGHIHKAQAMGSNIFYSGSTQSCNWGELDPKGFYIHSIAGAKPVSRFVETPSVKRIRLSYDYTEPGFDHDLDAVLYTYASEEMTGARVRFEAKVYVDEVDMVDTDKIRDFFLSTGAETCEVIRIRVPRVQARSSRLVKLERLRDRLVERAALMEQEVPGNVLVKADLLESDPEGVVDFLEDKNGKEATEHEHQVA